MDQISGDPPASPSFACGMCGKCFSDAEQMKIHIQTHTGKQPFRCIICWPLFYDMSSSQSPEPSPMLVQPAASSTTGPSNLTTSPTTGTSHLPSSDTTGALQEAVSGNSPSLSSEVKDAVSRKMKLDEQTTGQVKDAHASSGEELCKTHSVAELTSSVASNITSSDYSHSSSQVFGNNPENSCGHLPISLDIHTVSSSETDTSDPHSSLYDTLQSSLNSTMNQRSSSMSQDQGIALGEESASTQKNTDRESFTNCGRRKKGRPKRLAGDVSAPFYFAESQRLHQEAAILNDHMYSISLDRGLGDHQKPVGTQIENSEDNDAIDSELEINHEGNTPDNDSLQEFHESQTVTVPLETYARKASQNLRKVSPEKHSTNDAHQETQNNNADTNETGTPANFHGVINFLKNVQVRNFPAKVKETRIENTYATRSSTISVSGPADSAKPLSDSTTTKKRMQSSSDERSSPRRPSSKKGRDNHVSKAAEGNRENQPVSTTVRSSSPDRQSPVCVLRKGRSKKSNKGAMKIKSKYSAQVAETAVDEGTQRKRPEVQLRNGSDVSSIALTSKQSTLVPAREGVSNGNIVNASPTTLATRQRPEMEEIGQETKSYTSSRTRQADTVSTQETIAQKPHEEVLDDSQERDSDVIISTANDMAQNQVEITLKSHLIKSVSAKDREADDLVQNQAEVSSGVSIISLENAAVGTETVTGDASKITSSCPKDGEDKLKEITSLSVPEEIAAARVAKGSSGGSIPNMKTRVIVSPTVPQSPPMGISVLASVAADANHIPVVTSSGNAANMNSTANFNNTPVKSKTYQPVSSSQSIGSSQLFEQPSSNFTSTISNTKEIQSSNTATSSQCSVHVDRTSSDVPNAVSATSSVLSVNPTVSMDSLAIQHIRTLSTAVRKDTDSPSKNNNSTRQEVDGEDQDHSSCVTSITLKDPELLRPTAKNPFVSLARIEGLALKELKSGKPVSVTCDQPLEQNPLAASILINTGKPAADSECADNFQDSAREDPDYVELADSDRTFLYGDESSTLDSLLSSPRRETRSSPRKFTQSNSAEKNKSPQRQKTGSNNTQRHSSLSNAELGKRPDKMKTSSEKIQNVPNLKHSPRKSLHSEMKENWSRSLSKVTQSKNHSVQETTGKKSAQKQTTECGGVNDCVYPRAVQEHEILGAETGTEIKCLPYTHINETRSEDGAPQEQIQTLSDSETIQLTTDAGGTVTDSPDGLQPAPYLEKHQSELSCDVQTSAVVSQVSSDLRTSPAKSGNTEQVSEIIQNTISNFRNRSEASNSSMQKQGPKRKVRMSAEKQLADVGGNKINLQELFTPVHKLRKRHANPDEFEDGESSSKSDFNPELGHEDSSSVLVTVDVHCDPSQRRDDYESSLNTFDLPVTFAGESNLTSYCHSLDPMPSPHGESPQNTQIPSDSTSKPLQERQSGAAISPEERNVKCNNQSDKSNASVVGNSSLTGSAAEMDEKRRQKIKPKVSRKLPRNNHLPSINPMSKKASNNISSPHIFIPSVAESVQRAERTRKSVVHLHPTPDLETTMAQIAKSIATSSVPQVRSAGTNSARHTDGSEVGQLNTLTKPDLYSTVSVTPGNFSLGKVSQYICKKCGAKFKKYSKYLFHKKNHGKDRFECDTCGVTLGRRESLKAHRMIHTGEAAVNCDVCGKTLCNQQSLATHMRIHTGERPYSCPLCPKTFRQQPGLVSHYRTHTKDRPFKCNICGKSYRFQKNLYNHKFTHTGERRYVCKICSASYFQLTALNVHYKLHIGEKPFGCDYCSMHFSQKINMQKHIRQVHQDKLRAKEEASVKNIGKPYHCSSCSRGFTTVRAMHRHMKQYCISILPEVSDTEDFN